MPMLVPEIDVSDLDASLAFYESICGFAVVYGRPFERFAYLTREGAELMLQEAAGPGRRFRTAPLEPPFGRGVNFQIEVSDVDSLQERCAGGGVQILFPIEERWYRTNRGTEGSRQLVVADPDGYVLRFFTNVGHRRSPS
jgi:catechol 2,3-dioxygenase-like lactoylglutathione lyase family enzyme